MYAHTRSLSTLNGWLTHITTAITFSPSSLYNDRSVAHNKIGSQNDICIYLAL